ncbi:MAG TPA: acetate--CoA ligase family protein [Gemmatimonadaceae bacterium]|nr:acetate--CoA ligase family protein [Gemmatimonadaceae bacterium]
MPNMQVAPDVRLVGASRPLDPILSPRSIAVIGASRTPRTMGHQVLINLIEQGFTGPVYPVNPAAVSICGVRAYPSIRDVPDPVDLAVVVVPKEKVADVAAECGAAGVRGLVVISAGFREVGRAGLERERRLVEIVRRHDMRMVGPNCMGVINASPAVSMNATFAPCMPPVGHAAFVSQSGALGLSVLDYAREYGIGISQFVSVGNKPDVSGNDLLEHWEHDPDVKVILMYVENFGNPAKFLSIASRITRVKPIVVVKAGRSKSGARAAVSHTGAMAASDVAVDALLTQAGVLRAGTIEELFDIAMAFGVTTLPRSRRVAVVTNAGGPGILAADAIEGVGLELEPLSDATVAEIRPLLPPETAVGNPLDLIASATAVGYRKAMTALLDDPRIDCVMPIFIPPLGVDQDAVADAITDAARGMPDKPVLAVLMGRQGLSKWRSDMHAAGIPTYIFPESAARAIAALNRYREIAQEGPDTASPLPVEYAVARAIISSAQREGRARLSEMEAFRVLEAYGIPAVPTRFAANREQAVEAACELGFPIAMKVVSPDIAHKTDVGGVVLDINGERAATQAFDRIRSDVGRRAPHACMDGVLVEHQVDGGIETVIGMTRDPKFGPLVMFGLGGIFVEALHDVVFRIAPLAMRDARAMVNGVRGAAVLRGLRGMPPVDRDALIDALRRVSQLAVDFPEIAELDVNPLLAFEHRLVAVDCRIVLQTTPESSPRVPQ